MDVCAMSSRSITEYSSVYEKRNLSWFYHAKLLFLSQEHCISMASGSCFLQFSDPVAKWFSLSTGGQWRHVASVRGKGRYFQVCCEALNMFWFIITTLGFLKFYLQWKYLNLNPSDINFNSFVCIYLSICKDKY